MSWQLLASTAFVLVVGADREALQKHPWLGVLAICLLFVGMYPGFDAIARYSVWLHSLQSLIIHHVAPLLLLFAGIRPCKIIRGFDSITESGPATAMVALSFTAMTLLWVSPGLHFTLMESPEFYGFMKWAMAASGIVLCNVFAAQNVTASETLRRRTLLNVAVAIPQTFAGIYLIANPPLFEMSLCLTSPVNWLPSLNAVQDQRLGGALLVAASAILLFGDLTWCRKRLAKSFTAVA